MLKNIRLGFVVIILFLVVFLGFRNSQVQSQVAVDMSNHRSVMIQMVSALTSLRQNESGSRVIFDRAGRSGDVRYVAPLLDIAYFTRASLTDIDSAIYNALRQLTGQAFDDNWRLWFEWASEANVDLPPSYDEFKGLLFATVIDPAFERFFSPGVMNTARVNMLEAVWGGVRVDGIPSLVNAPQITPEEALAEGERLTQFCRDSDCRYPAPDEFVFGVSINGDNRAYPLRLLNWHEMFNDVLGTMPLYDTPGGSVVCNFRAPTLFSAVARQGDGWVYIVGESAGCPETGGWLADPEALEWPGQDGWSLTQMQLPDVSESGAEALTADQGIDGRVPGMPVMLAYCTLCGSGILYNSTIDDLVVNGESQGRTVLEFGSTGMLMRSNKLMYDRNTDTVWNALTGEPAFGPLATSNIRLEILPVVISDWATWLEEHPDTSVLSLETGYQRPYVNGEAYNDYFNNPDFIMFPVWQQDTSQQENKEVVFTLIIDNTPKAYPLRLIVPEQVTNDTLAGQSVVIVSRGTPERDFFEPGGAAVRAYERGDYVFSPGVSPYEVIDADGAVWNVTEDALIAPDGTTLPRIGGHLAFWFGWYGFHPDTLVYESVP